VKNCCFHTYHTVKIISKILCHNTHYFCLPTFTTFCSERRYIHGGQCSDVHYKICSERHYTTIVRIVADISSDLHYI